MNVLFYYIDLTKGITKRTEMLKISNLKPDKSAFFKIRRITKSQNRTGKFDRLHLLVCICVYVTFVLNNMQAMCCVFM